MFKLRQLYREMQPSDRRILIGSALLMLLFGFILTDGRMFNSNEKSNAPSIGKVTSVASDVRHKQANQLTWNRATSDGTIHLGDSVFTGSRSKAILNIDKSTLHVGENSLVNFKRMKGIDVSNLNLGSFKIKVNGSLQVAINGDLVKFNGRGSEIEASIDENRKVTFKALKGKTEISSAKLGEIEVNDRNPVKEEKFLAAYPPAPFKEQVEPVHYWRVNEYYTQINNKFRVRSELPKYFAINYSLQWKDSQAAQYNLQLASDSEFSQNVELFESPEKQYTLPRLRVGDTFWRVSRVEKDAGEQWSRVAHFNFQPRFTKDTPRVLNPNTNLSLGANGSHYTLKWNSSPEKLHEAYSYFVEVSEAKDFPAHSTFVARTTELSHDVHFSKPGTYYFRVRSANPTDQLSEAAHTSVTVFTAPLLAAPLLPKGEMAFRDPSKPIILPWRGPKGAREYDVIVTGARAQSGSIGRVKGDRLIIPQMENGPYTYQVTAVDEMGRLGRASILKSFTVKKPNTMLSERKPTQSIAAEAEKQKPPEYLNQKYPDSRIQIEGAGFTMYSTGQVEDGEKSPLAATMGLRVLRWTQSLGLEGFLKSKIFNYNSEASNVSPLSAEVRGHKRWTLPLRWRDILREIQISLFLGAEYYRNGGSDQFAKQYTLMKAGTLITFPLAQRWDTGGELVYGRGADSSVKYEISGFLNYYIKKRWTYGLGYRIHLLEAGTSVSPTGAEFREGYVEVFSALKYLY